MNTTTINTQTRREYAQLLRCFLAGKLTTDEYEEQYYAIARRVGSDDAAEDTFFQVCELYDDIVPHRMTGKYRLPPSTRRDFARCVLFLRTELPYELTNPRTGAEGCWAAAAVTLSFGAIIIWLASARDLAICSGILAGVGVLDHIWVKLVHAVQVRKAENESRRPRPEIPDPQGPNLWPFSNDQDLNAARQTPTFLCGGRVKRPQAC